MEVISVREYSAFCVGKKNNDIFNGCHTLTKSTFEMLESFLLENKRDGENDTFEIMGLSTRRGVGKVITVKNYVGIISLKDGTTIEILPKIYSENEDNKENARSLLVKMLNTLYNVSSKSLQTASLDVCKMNLLEAFIRMFIDEVTRLTKQGLKSTYETLEDDLTCLKGKIIFSKHLLRNFAHKERVYSAYDEFTVNRAENKLLKSTLSYLFSKTRSSRNKKDIKNLLSLFDNVEPSSNYDADFDKIVADRNTKSYTTALNWARVFLKKKSFTSFSGSTVSIALLFPMEKLFECYVPALIRGLLSSQSVTLSTQDKRYHLFDEPKRFLLNPDIVLTANDKIFIMDTKWKRLNNDKGNNYGISQSDTYQMYTYFQKYNVAKSVHSVTLLYPKSPDLSDKIGFIDKTTGAKINVRFIDMLNDKESLKQIFKEYEIL